MDSPFESSEDSEQEGKSGEESGQEETNEPEAAKSSASEEDEKSSSDEESTGQPAAEQSDSDESNAENNAAADSDDDASNPPADSDNEGKEEAAADSDEAASDSDGDQGNENAAESDEEPNQAEAYSDEDANRIAPDSDQDETQEESDGNRGANEASEADSSADEAAVKQEDESDSEDGDKTTQNDLFGGADDISSSDDDKEATLQESTEKGPLQFSDDDDDKETEQAVKPPAEDELQETRIEVEIPRINTNLGRAIHFVRFPNFVSVETRPFDPAVYEDEIEDDELMDEEGRTRMKLKVENTIRWKKYTDENGINITESNARLVRWSDGSLSMHLGSEIFDVHAMPLQGDHNHLFIRQGTGLQGQAVFKTKLTFRPHSTKSATHRKMTSRLAMRLNQSQQKVRVLPIAGQDPESRKAKLMKEEEDQLRAHMRREAQKRRMREKAHARGLNANYLEDRLDEDDDTGAISVSAIKNKFKPGFGGARNIYTSDSESGDERQLTKAKRLESDDSDDDIGKSKDKSEEGEKKKRKYVSDSDSEAEESSAPVTDDVKMESQEHSSDSD